MKIKLNNCHIIDATSDITILEAAKSASITLEHSCLNGRCSECKVKVVTGEYDMPNNQEGLTEEEVSQGYCLSCITKPKTDLILTEVGFFEGVLPETRILPAKISSLDFLSNDVARVKLRTPPNNILNFIPGQYIDISVQNIKRSYSIASIPSDSTIELLIKNYPNGKFSNYLFQEAKKDDLLRIEGPKGTYILPDVIPENIIFVSTGTGIAPNLSLIRSILKNDPRKSSQIILIHGERKVDDHIYSLEYILPGVKIIKVISREHSHGFFNGYVQDVFDDLDLELNESIVFACGNAKMVMELKSLLVSLGLNQKKFKSDIFVPSN